MKALVCLMAAAFMPVVAPREEAVFLVQGMTWGSCQEEVRAGLSKIRTAKSIKVLLKPPRATLTFEPGKVSLQDVVAAVRAAGRTFDAKVLLVQDPKLPQTKLDELDKALEKVPGVKNTGAPDEAGLREITLDLAKKTSLEELEEAGRSVGVRLESPPFGGKRS